MKGLCQESPSAVLLNSGPLMLIVGFLLWLAGLYFRTAIVGLMGAAAGLFCGLAVSQWLNLSAWICSAAGAALVCLVLVLFNKAVLMLLATLVFAPFGTIIYCGLAPQQSSAALLESMGSSVHLPLNHDTSAQIASVSQFIKNDSSFSTRLHLLFEENVQHISLQQLDILLTALLAGMIGVLLCWHLRKPVMALCCSGIGTFLIVIGLEIALLGMNIHFSEWFQEHPENLSIIYLSLVLFGVIVQFLTLVIKKQAVMELSYPCFFACYEYTRRI